MTTKVLLIDDDQAMAQLLGNLLASHGFDLTWADRPSDALAALTPDIGLVLLDVMLPERDGFQFCRDLRGVGDRRPIIMLTGRGDELDRIHGLKAGADDYLPKPFNYMELIARMEAVLRRSGQPVADESPAPPRGMLDVNRRTLRLGEREITLTPTEYRLLEVLTARPGRTYTRGELLNAVDDTGGLESFDRAIDLHISRLRGKVEPDVKSPRHLLTVRGVGYRFEW